MSAFLGPIHIKMYNRILYQDAMAQVILEYAEEKGWAFGVRELADVSAPAASNAPLETLIDEKNIHGWLSEAVAGSERRFALIAGAILAGHPEGLGELQSLMKNMGRQSGLLAMGDAEQAFQAAHDMLLDGMPCDFPFSISESSSEAVVWQVAGCPHTLYWQAQGYNPETYYLLRDAWIEGALAGSGINHTRVDCNHAMRKEL